MGRKGKRKNVAKASGPATQPASASARQPRGQRFVLRLGAVIAVVACLAIGISLWGTKRFSRTASPAAAATPVSIIEPLAQVYAGYAGSASCRQCHAEPFIAWSRSHHALAERPVDPKHDAAALASKPAEVTSPQQRVIGEDPLRQFLLPATGGRLQVTQAAYDPHKGDWFDVFGNDGRRAGDWGHWTGRGMNWNSMCAACHNTRLRKNYDPATDTYDTKMAEMGVSCESCHGPMKPHVTWQLNHRRPGGAGDGYGSTTSSPDPTIKKLSRDAMFETCGSCHSRREDLIADFVPGQSYDDHFRLAVVDETEIYYPDGQVHDEDYEYAAFLGSRMHTAGVRCSDCHNPHTAKPILDGDALCMRCHVGDGAGHGGSGFLTAPVIRPAEHVFHKPESAGARCINCHMPQTTYMQRHVRHDHGFTVPDPLLTKEFGIPNGCNRCHADKDADWSIAAVDKWYGSKMQRPSRQRAQVIARARRGDESARQPLMNLLADAKETPYWKAAAAGMLSRWIGDPTVASAVGEQLHHPEAIVRGAAARSLGPLAASQPSVRDALRKLLEDPRRAVRVTAAWALRAEVDPNSTAGRELLHVMQTNADQPTGRLQIAHYDLARRDVPSALRQASLAAEWEPNSADMHREMAMLLSDAGQPQEAVRQLQEACRLAPQEAEFQYLLGLAENEAGNLPATVAALEQAVRLNPAHAQAWYNLGLAQNSMGKIDAALNSLQQAASRAPSDPRIPYARATILLQSNRRDEALADARRALEINPDYEPARRLILTLGAVSPAAPH